jgi:peptidoglycan L-alanyl-D-glutamate endopeptidase CwlK
MSRDLSGLLPAVRERAEAFLNLASLDGYPLVITETYRSPERQAELYAQGRTAPGPIVTNARPGQSLHEQRRAFDVCFPGPEPYSDAHPWHLLGEWAKQAGLEWGGHWHHPDRPHLQLSADQLYKAPAPTETRPTLRRGQFGPDVIDLRDALEAAGYPTAKPTSPAYTYALSVEVQRFQAEHSLKVDGIVGPATWAALDQAARREAP